MKTDAKKSPPPGPAVTSVVVVDEHGAIRSFFRETVGRWKNFEIVPRGHRADALRLAREFVPTLLIMELMLREMNATAVLGELRAMGSRTRTVIFTGSRNEAALIDALRMRPHGLAHKDEPLPALWATHAMWPRSPASRCRWG